MGEFSYLSAKRQTLEMLVAEYGDALVRFAYCFTGNADAAEDIAEDAFVVLFLKKKRFACEKQLRAYLFKTVRNRCLDYLRGRRRTFGNEKDAAEMASSVNADALIEERSDARTVYRCMQALPPQYKDVLYLHYFEGYSPEEIAANRLATRKQIYNALARAKLALRKLLEQEGVS